ncbi:AAA family ATPase [Muricoccus vinaceus]|uniref:AAA family ATPase n=1 Tax=Muricoccus vinaceus TaxID=424704 RepID=A0ABV6IT39_9PROT
MRLLAFRVQNYRNIEDSGWIQLEQVTALVGRNESGKTTLLKALHKFNPAAEEDFDGQRDFPRDRYTTDFREGKDWPACSVRFEISGQVAETLASLMPEGQPLPTSAVCTRYYDGHLTAGFEPPLIVAPVSGEPIIAALTAFGKAARRLEAPSAEQEEATKVERAALLEWSSAWKDKIKPVVDLRDPTGVSILQDLKKEADAKSGPRTADMLDTLLEVVEAALDEARKPDPSQAARNAVAKAMPVFIYFENYGILDSAVWLPRFLEDAQREPNNARIRTINAMFRHVGLSAEDLQKLGVEQASQQRRGGNPVSPEILAQDQRRKEERSIKLSSASSAITRRFGEWWSQRRHRIRYDADGDFFRIWISDDRRPDVEIELESRSKGFQWFLSFYLVFLVESDDGHRDAVLLLDEPGLNLHPTAQQELIAFFERLSERNQLIYSTHSPFLIDGDNLQRVRPVVEGDDGHSRVSAAGMWPKDRETIFPLQAAAGYAMLKGLLSQRDNILVEGMTDYYLLHALGAHCREAGLSTLPADAHVVPCGGVPMVGKLAALFLGEQARALVLLDGDKAGRDARSTLLRDLYKGHESAVLVLDDALGGEGLEIEDLVGEEVFLAGLNAALGLAITIIPEDREQGSVVKRVAAAARRSGIELPEGWKVTAVLRLVGDWAEKRSPCPQEAMERATKLFEALAARLGSDARAAPHKVASSARSA